MVILQLNLNLITKQKRYKFSKDISFNIFFFCFFEQTSRFRDKLKFQNNKKRTRTSQRTTATVEMSIWNEQEI